MTLTFQEYTVLALRTKPKNHVRDWTMMGLFGEAGEIVDLIKKIVAHGHPITDEVRQKVKKEIGDTLWYVAIGADEDLKGDKISTSAFDVVFNTSIPNPASNEERALRAKAIRIIVSMIEDNDVEIEQMRRSYAMMIGALNGLAASFDTTLERCAIENVAKLRARYPDGFSTEASIARVDIRLTPQDCEQALGRWNEEEARSDMYVPVDVDAFAYQPRHDLTRKLPENVAFNEQEIEAARQLPLLPAYPVSLVWSDLKSTPSAPKPRILGAPFDEDLGDKAPSTAKQYRPQDWLPGERAQVISWWDKNKHRLENSRVVTGSLTISERAEDDATFEGTGEDDDT